MLLFFFSCFFSPLPRTAIALLGCCFQTNHGTPDTRFRVFSPLHSPLHGRCSFVHATYSVFHVRDFATTPLLVGSKYSPTHAENISYVFGVLS